MNEKVENLIKQEKDRLDASKKQMRDNHLISLGLIDENKIERKYLNYDSDNPPPSAGYATLDPDTNRYYVIGKNTALEVTDEEYEEICKYFPPTPIQKEILKTATAAENTLNIIAGIVLVCGIIGFFICLFTIAFVSKDYDTEFSAIGFIISIGVLLTSLTTWSILRVICEIAINLRQINNKTK